MRLSSHALVRSCTVLATAVLTSVPAGIALSAPAALATGTSRQPHVAGGYLASGVRVAPKTSRSGAHASDVLPVSVDLRADAPSPGDQGQIGSCVAWTIAYDMMGYYAKRTAAAGVPYAPLFLYMRNVAPGGAPNAGLYPDSVLANAQSAGVDTQADYWQGSFNWQAAPTTAEINNAANYKVAGWTRLFNGANQGDAAKASIKQALAAGNPVGIAIPVYQDFMYLGQHTLYNTVNGTSLGGHMITIFGYDDQGVWIRNSWGTYWGNGGDAKLSWAFINKNTMAAYTISGVQATPGADPAATAPTVTGLSTMQGGAGTAVTITGTGLSGATKVRFGDTPVTFTSVVDGGNTKLLVTAPPHAAGSAAVTVTTPAGTSAPSAASTFTYPAAPSAPTIAGLTPSSVSTLGGATVTVSGSGLLGVTGVMLGNKTVAAQSVTDTSLTFVAPAHGAETVNVTIKSTTGTSGAAPLTYVLPNAPVITSVSPNNALVNASTPVVLTGTDFVGATKVYAGDRSLPFSRLSDTSLKVTMPPHAAGDVSLTVVTPSGPSAFTDGSRFTYQPLPVPAVSGISPNTGLTYTSTPVVVTGSNLGGATKVTVDGKSVGFTKLSDTSVKLTLTAHPAGNVTVLVSAAGGTSPATDGTQFSYVAPPAPTLDSLSPSTGTGKSAATVLLYGSGFKDGLTKVTANGMVLNTAVISENQLRVVIPARGVGDVSLVVNTPGGSSGSVTYSVRRI